MLQKFVAQIILKYVMIQSIHNCLKVSNIWIERKLFGPVPTGYYLVIYLYIIEMHEWVQVILDLKTRK